MTITRLFGASTLAIVLAGGAMAADDNMEKLQNFKVTGATIADQKPVVQGGEYAAQIRENLQRVTLPEGFEISLYAVVPDARHMAVGTNVGAVFVGTRKEDVWVVTDRNKDRIADEVKRFAPSVTFNIPNGPCFSPDGILYVAEHNRVLAFPAAEFFYESPDVAVAEVVPQGGLIPEDEESFNHGARVCTIGPDNKLYIAIGQPFNVAPKDKLEKYTQHGIGSISRMDRDGSNFEIYAHGVRNSVGMDFNPADGKLWWTDNQVDGMGDDIPPGEINRSDSIGQHFGHPYYGGGAVRTIDYQDDEIPVEVVMPQSETIAHAADLGMTFYTGGQFPSEYQGAIFSAQHGSWNRTEPVGARVMVTFLDENGDATETKPFAEGWLLDTGEYLGRPVDVQMLPDGSLLVSDDLAGALYRIAYNG